MVGTTQCLYEMRNRIVASEILTSGFCPFNCSYCYIPKTDMMKQLHERIVESLESGRFIDTLSKLYGKNLQSLGLWGTEPLLTLPIIQKYVPTLLERFPRLNELSFSTSMMYKPGVLVDFIKSLTPTRPFKLKVQISLDGPDFITDVNRMKGAAEKIPENFLSVVKSLNDVDLDQLSVEFKWKVTFSIDNIKLFVEQPGKIDEFVAYFEDINRRFKEVNRNRRVSLLYGTYCPTLVVPGKYTSSDGRLFARFLDLMYGKGYKDSYYYRLKRLIRNSGETLKRHVFSCSGGDSNLGVEPDTFHICHRTFYYDDDEYIQSVLKTNIENWDVSNFTRGAVDYMRKFYIVPVDDEYEQARFFYVLRGYHDFWKLQISYVTTMVRELALIGQASKIYLDDDIALMFALFINSATSCPMENLLNTSAIHFQTISMIRMFANGAFERILKEVLKDELSGRKQCTC